MGLKLKGILKFFGRTAKDVVEETAERIVDSNPVTSIAADLIVPEVKKAIRKKRTK